MTDIDQLKKLSWNDIKEHYLEFHGIDKFTEDMAIDVDFGHWLASRILSPADVRWLPRYSLTMEDDDMGRWARVAVYKNIRIAWISRLEVKGKVVFSVSCHFPTMQNDTANEHKVCLSLDEAKDFVKERWEWFLCAVS